MNHQWQTTDLTATAEGRAAGCSTCFEAEAVRPAFTLLEVLLVIALLVVLMAMGMPLFGNALARHQLGESAERLRSLMYLTGAEAKQSGRRLELIVSGPAEQNYLAAYATGDQPAGNAYSQVVVQIERDPLGAAGTFDQLKADWAIWSTAGPTVQIAQIQISEPIPVAGDDFSRSAGAGAAADAQDAPPTILFGPDGRSQVGDVMITVVNDRLDGYLVQLRGATGLATVKPMPAIQGND